MQKVQGRGVVREEGKKRSASCALIHREKRLSCNHRIEQNIEGGSVGLCGGDAMSICDGTRHRIKIRVE